jgi:GNAT superfamily N-acetyltransferase
MIPCKYKNGNMFRIIKLSQQYLEEACVMADRVFSHSDDKPSIGFSASLDKNKLEKLNMDYQKQYGVSILSLEYFIALDEISEKVIGTTGLYSLEEDANEAYWVGWFCVHPDFTGQGIGRALLKYIIEISRASGKRFLRLYTSDHPVESTAQFLYESMDFKIWNEKGERKDGNTTIFYRMLDLTNQFVAK